MGSAPDPGCECRASTSPKNTGERSKIILLNEYNESELSSLMTNHDNFQLNEKKRIRTPHLSTRCPAHQITYLKSKFLHIFFFSDSTFSRNMDYFIYHSEYGNFLDDSQNPRCWIRCTYPWGSDVWSNRKYIILKDWSFSCNKKLYLMRHSRMWSGSVLWLPPASGNPT